MQATRNASNEITLDLVNRRIPTQTCRYFADSFDLDQATLFRRLLTEQQGSEPVSNVGEDRGGVEQGLVDQALEEIPGRGG